MISRTLRYALLPVFAGICLTLTSMGQQPEDKKAEPKQERRIPKASDALRTAVSETKEQYLRDLYLELVTPHDRAVVSSRTQKGELRICPLPIFSDGEPTNLPVPLVLAPIDRSEKVLKFDSGDLDEITRLQCYENKVLGKLDLLFNKSRMIPQHDKLVAAELILSEVMRFHNSERGPGKLRNHESWNTVRNKVETRLTNTRTELLRSHISQKDFRSSFDLVKRYVELYPNPDNPLPMQQALGEVIDGAWAAGEKEWAVLPKIRELWLPKRNHPVLKGIPAKLESKARDVHRLALQAREKKQDRRSEQLLALAGDIWPDLKELQGGQLIARPNRKGVLLVGVRNLPKRFSPSSAASLIEKECTNLIFEGLLAQRIDSRTGRTSYSPELATRLPEVIPRGPRSKPGRSFLLPREARWSDGRRVTAGDVRFSVELMRDGHGWHRTEIWSQMLGTMFVGGNSQRVDIPLVRGCVDPLAWMTFPIVPEHAGVKQQQFDTKPIGSGPYRLESVDAKKNLVVFSANQQYSKRPGMIGRPRLQKIELVETSDLAKALKDGKVDLVLDLTAEEAASLQSATLVVPFPKSENPRRTVHFLAVNHRIPLLANNDMRHALAKAIDRRGLLDQFFRAGLKQTVHTPLGQVYPVGSWAEALSGLAVSDPHKDVLHQPDLAAGLFRKAMKSVSLNSTKLKLVYPTGDPAIEQAMTALAKQLSSLSSSEATLKIDLVAQSPDQLRQTVERTRNYDLAYYSYTFPDQTYWLGPILGKAGADGSNFLGYQNDRVVEYLARARAHREFEDIRSTTKKLAGEFALDMPLIPLWQLDRLHAWHGNLSPVEFDPDNVFSSVERWTLESSSKEP